LAHLILDHCAIGSAIGSAREPPQGGIRDLYRWVQSVAECPGEWPLSDPEARTFRDGWGRELVYRLPPRQDGNVFDLYSVGPNGIDEGGEGDDITAAPYNLQALWIEFGILKETGGP